MFRDMGKICTKCNESTRGQVTDSVWGVEEGIREQSTYELSPVSTNSPCKPIILKAVKSTVTD